MECVDIFLTPFPLYLIWYVFDSVGIKTQNMRRIITPLTTMLLVISSSLSLSAQTTLYNNGGLLHANKNALLHIDAEIENKTTSTLENDGVIEITSNFTNDSTAIFTIGSDGSSTERAVKFIGSGLQFIYGNISDTVNRYFYNLVIDKSGSGSALTLHTNASVKGSLVFGSSTSGASTYTPMIHWKMTMNCM